MFLKSSAADVLYVEEVNGKKVWSEYLWYVIVWMWIHMIFIDSFNECISMSTFYLILRLIDWGLMPFPTFVQSYHDSQFTYSCVSWLSHTSYRHNNLSKQLAAFPHRLLALLWKTNDACLSQWLLSNDGNDVGRAGIRTDNPWINSPRRYRLRYRGLDIATDCATEVRT